MPENRRIRIQNSSFAGCRVALAIGLLGCCVFAIASLGERAARSTGPDRTELAAGQFYDIPVTHNGVAVFDLPTDDASEYVLVVSSLGYSGREFEATLKASPAIGPTESPFQPIQSMPRSVRSQYRRESASNRKSDRADDSNSDHKLIGYEVEDSSRICPLPAADVRRTFYVHVTDGPLDEARNYTRVSGRLIAQGSLVAVYLDESQQVEEIAPELANSIIDIMETDVIPGLRDKIGECHDVDGDRRFSILLTSWLGRLQGGKTSLMGFVRGDDFRNEIVQPFSNSCDMMYLNSSVVPGNKLRDLLWHEYTHAVCFSQRAKASSGSRRATFEEDWLNEAIAHMFEQGPTNIDYRISRFLNSSSKYPLVVSDYFGAGMWRNHGCRGAVYLFLSWCVQSFGDEILRELVHSPVTGTRNLEWATGMTFRELYRHWTLAIAQSHTHQSDMNLFGQVGNWGIAGPHWQNWNLANSQKALKICGTATAYLKISPQTVQRRQQIKFQGHPEGNWQISLKKVRKQSNKLDIVANWQTLENYQHDDLIADAGTAIRVELSQSNKNDYRLELIACEQHTASSNQSAVFLREELATLRNGTAGSTCPGSKSSYLLPTQFSHSNDIPTVLKAVYRSTDGHCFSAWTVLEGVSASPQNAPLVADVPPAGSSKREVSGGEFDTAGD